MLVRVSRGRETLPDGWEQPIPEAFWPESLIAAISIDIGVLGTPRAIATIRGWQRDAFDGRDPALQREARRWLEELRTAIVRGPVPADARGPPEPPDAFADSVPGNLTDSNFSDAFSVDQTPAFPIPGQALTAEEDGGLTTHGVLAAGARGRLSSARTPAPEISVEDDAILYETHAGGSGPPAPRTAPRAPGSTEAPAITEDDERPTALRERAAARGALPAPARPAIREEDERPTASVAFERLAANMSLAQRAVSLAGFAEHAEDPDDPAATPPPSANPLVRPTRPMSPGDLTPAAVGAVKAVRSSLGEALAPSLTRPAREDASLAAGSRASRVAPKPGIVRRRLMSRRESIRPRAAMQQVRAMYDLLLPLCLELVPLPVERRARRFWARWREVAGVHGVRREVLEELLRSAKDVQTLACGLIAETQSVDLRSVEALVERLERASEDGQPAADIKVTLTDE